MHLSVSFLNLRLQLALEVLVVLDIRKLLVIAVYFIADCAALVVREGPALEVVVVVLDIDVALGICDFNIFFS